MKPSKNTFTHALVIDLEATCCNRGSLNKDTIEIIEIGAFLVELKSFTTCFDFHQYVQPVKSTTITSFCSRLTGIQQADVENAPYFPQIVEELTLKLQAYPQTVFANWSNFDWRQFQKDCQYHQIEFPFQNGCWDLQKLFCKKQKHKQLYSVKGALEMVKLEFEGREHSAYYDACNTAKLLPYCL